MSTSRPLTPENSTATSRRGLLKGAAAFGLAAGLPGGSPVPGAAAPARQADPALLTIAMAGTANNLDPHSSYEYRSTLAIRGPYEGLIALDGGAMDAYVPVIAESWSSNDDKSVWTFKIREGVTFQDGSVCDAEACRLSFERFLTLGLGPVNVISRFVSDPEQITAPDATTLVFDLGSPQPVFEAAVSSQYGPLIVNAAAAREHDDDGDWGGAVLQIDATGMGTGPYVITEFEPGSQVILERNESYWGGWQGGEFERIILRVVEEDATRRQLVEQGDVDIIDNVTPEALDALKQNPDVVLDLSYSTEVRYVAFTIGGLLESVAARQAMCAAFPYEEVVQGVYKGYGKRSIGSVAELCRGFAPDTPIIETDLEMARSLFAEAGVPEGSTFTCMVESGDEYLKTTAQLLQENLSQIGITLEIETADYAAVSAMFYGDAPVEERPSLQMGGWWPDYNDAYNHLYPQVTCDSWGSMGANAGFYCNEQVDAALETAKNALEENDYMSAMAEAQKILNSDDPCAIYYLEPQWISVVRSSIEGFVFNPIYQGTYDFYRLRRKA